MEQSYLISGANLVIVSILVLSLGKYLNDKLSFLTRYNIPMAVTGGLLSSILFTIVYLGFGVSIEFDMELRNLLLLAFFSTIGLSAKLKTLASGGKALGILLIFAISLLIFQDVVGIGIAMLLGQHPAYGLFAGSVSFAGGHGTAIAWGDVAEQVGLTNAGTLGIACATFGLVAGGLLGGPIGGYLIKKNRLNLPDGIPNNYEALEADTKKETKQGSQLPLESSFATLLLLALCVGLGHNVNGWLAGSGISLPPFLTAMFVGIVLTNLADLFKKEIHVASVNRAGEISLHLFLAMSLMSIQLWQLAGAIGPLLLILIGQMVLISTIAVFFVYRFLGRDYDAAVMAAGFMGLGLGATPVAIANMQSITSRYGPSSKAFIVVPLVGAFFVDLSNAVVIKAFGSLPLLREGLNIVGQ